MEITIEQAKEFKDVYAQNIGYSNWSDMAGQNSEYIDIHENKCMQQFAQEMVNKAVEEEKRLHEIEKHSEYNRGYKDGIESDKISITHT